MPLFFISLTSVCVCVRDQFGEHIRQIHLLHQILWSLTSDFPACPRCLLCCCNPRPAPSPFALSPSSRVSHGPVLPVARPCPSLSQASQSGPPDTFTLTCRARGNQETLFLVGLTFHKAGLFASSRSPSGCCPRLAPASLESHERDVQGPRLHFRPCRSQAVSGSTPCARDENLHSVSSARLPDGVAGELTVGLSTTYVVGSLPSTFAAVVLPAVSFLTGMVPHRQALPSAVPVPCFQCVHEAA